MLIDLIFGIVFMYSKNNIGVYKIIYLGSNSPYQIHFIIFSIATDS
jgi:hypothetical protein